LAALVEGRCTDALALDANYGRRSDAEIFWKEAQRMVAETEESLLPEGFVCLQSGPTAASEILKGSPEAAQWTAWFLGNCWAGKVFWR